MSDVVISLDSSDDEAPSVPQTSIAEQLRQRCKNLDVKSVKSKLDKIRNQPINSKTSVSVITKAPGSGNNAGMSRIGDTQIKPIKPKPANKTANTWNGNNISFPKIINSSSLAVNPVSKKNSPNTVPTIKIAPKVIPIINNTAKNVGNKIQMKNAGKKNVPIKNAPVKLVNPLKITALSGVGNSNNNINTAIQNVTISGGRMPGRMPLNSAKRKNTSNTLIQPLKKNKVLVNLTTNPNSNKLILDDSTRGVLDSVVRKVAAQQLIDLKNSQNPSDVIPTVEIDDDDDDPKDKQNFEAMEIPIEYEPDNSKENQDLSLDKSGGDPLELDELVFQDVEMEEEKNNSATINDKTDDVNNSDIDDDVALVDEEDLSLVNPEDPIDQSINEMNNGLGIISHCSSLSTNNSTLVTESTTSNIIETITITESPMSCKDQLDKSDFYTPKKTKDHDMHHAAANVSKDISKQFENAVPCEVIICLTPEDKKKVEQFEKASEKIKEKKRGVLKQLNYDSKESKKETNLETKKIEDPPKNVDSTERAINETYQRFIDLCFKFDSSEDMKKIVDKKIKGYYLSVPSSYTDSRTFLRFIEDRIKDITENPPDLFLHIKDVVDMLKVRRVKKKEGQDGNEDVSKPSKEHNVANGDDEGLEEEEDETLCELDEVTQSRIRKLERAMRKLNKAIKRLQEKEVDWDDDNSAYLLEDRYKARLVRIYDKICELSGGRNEASVRRTRTLKSLSTLSLCGGRFPKLLAAVRSASSSNPHWFPDYVDVLKCVEHCAKEQGLNLKQEDLHREARDAFVDIGTLLQKRRRAGEYEDFVTMLGSHCDPAEDDATLREALDRNKEMARNKEMEVINKFVEKQYKLNIEPEDVPDAEADKSEGSEAESEIASDNESKSRDNEDENSSNKVVTKVDIHKSGNKVVENDSRTVKSVEKPSSSSDNSHSVNSNLDDIEIVEEGVLDVPSCSDSSTKITVEKPSTSTADDRDKVVEEDDGSNSSLSLVDLISSDSRSSFNSGVEADTEDSKQSSRFKKLKSVRPSSVMSGMNMLQDESSGLELVKSSDDLDESTSEINTTVIEKRIDIQENDNAVDEEILDKRGDKTDDADVTMVGNSDVVMLDEEASLQESESVSTNSNPLRVDGKTDELLVVNSEVVLSDDVQESGSNLGPVESNPLEDDGNPVESSQEVLPLHEELMIDEEDPISTSSKDDVGVEKSDENPLDNDELSRNDVSSLHEELIIEDDSISSVSAKNCKDDSEKDAVNPLDGVGNLEEDISSLHEELIIEDDSFDDTVVAT